MARSAVVIIFDEPHNFKSILDSIKDIHKKEDKVHVYGAVNRSAESIISIVENDL